MAIASMIIGLAGTAASAVGGIISNKKRQESMDKARQHDNAFYQKQLYQDPTKRSENAALMRQLDINAKKANELAVNRAKVTGQAGMAQTALQQSQQANADAYGNAISNMAANESARRDNVTQNWHNAQVEHRNAQQAIDNSRAEQIGNMAKDFSGIVGQGIDSLEVKDKGTGTDGNGTGTRTNGVVTEEQKNKDAVRAKQ